ncbi:zinc finger, CCHC-type containing protein [Tanacetum coccineum]|uniref:Zinc finger, CCHC-type containing protein n=1 Tax=Tanacetum coccineum TaxID=301880 RepID=A0ABQ5J451_9ASTR
MVAMYASFGHWYQSTGYRELIQVSCIIDKLSPSWKDFKHTLKHLKEELTLVELGSHLRFEESLRMQDSDKPKGNNVVGPLVFNIVEHNNFSRYNDNKGKRKHHDNTKSDPNKKSKVTCWKCGKPGHLKKDCKGGKVGNKANGSGINGLVDGSTNSLKACGLTQGNESTALVHGLGCVDLKFSSGKIVSLFNVLHVPNIRKNLVSSSVLNNYGYKQHARLGHVRFKRMQDMSKDRLIPAFDMDTKRCKTCMMNKITKKPFQNVKFETKVLELIHNDLCDLHATPSLDNKKYFMTFIDDASRFCYVYLLHSKDEALNKFKVFKTEVELQQGSQIKRFRTDRGGLNQGFWGEAMTVVRLYDPKLKTLGKRGIECIFVGYAEHSKTFRFYVIEPNESVLINSINESRDAIFDENRFSSVPKPRTKDEVFDQHSYCFNVEDDPKTFDEAMKSQDVAF